MQRRGPPPFADRAEAGALLADRVAALGLKDPAIFALPRGGVPVAAVVADRLGAPLDLVLVRKLSAPGQPELALGAVTDGDAPEMVLNEDIVAVTGAAPGFIAAARAAALAEIARRRALYLGGRVPVDPRGRAAVVVDDGLATGATARVALRALRRRGAAPLLLAIPVAPPETLAALAAGADAIICLHKTAIPFGIGAFYADFHQLSDAEVVGLLAPPRG